MKQMTKSVIEAPPLKAIGPYSLGIASGDYIHYSGQIPLDPGTGKLVEGGIAAQTEQVFANLKTVLAAANLTLADVVKSTVFLTDMNDFAAMNEIYAKHVSTPYPARSTIAVTALPLGASVEIEVIAYRTPDN